MGKVDSIAISILGSFVLHCKIGFGQFARESLDLLGHKMEYHF